MIKRAIQGKVSALRNTGKAIIIQGARQVGKTTLIHHLLEEETKVLWVDGDDPNDRILWNDTAKAALVQYVKGFRYLVIDEAQRIENIGLAIKMLVDLKIDLQIIVTGSSSLSLTSSINEPLTGRKWSFELYPLSWSELVNHDGLLPALRRLDQLLITGSYPEIVTAEEMIQLRLQEIATSYLYKDVLEYGNIRKPELIVKLLRALAYQVGSEVSYHELAQLLQVDNKTILRYIDLLEDSYVIFRLEPLSTNPRKEISTSRKIYFWDNGIRNAVIDNLTPLSTRSDHGLLWENFVVSEYRKLLGYAEGGGKLYFWRSKGSAEIDLVLARAGAYHAYEIKYNPRKKVRFTPSFVERYQPKTQAVINRENFHEVLGGGVPGFESFL
jgi:hypothetical protein